MIYHFFDILRLIGIWAGLSAWNLAVLARPTFRVFSILTAYTILGCEPPLHSTASTYDHASRRLSVKEILASLPQQDIVDLNAFFHQLFASGDFAYTLFGDKPLALIDYMPRLQLESRPTQNSLRSLAIVHKGAKVWEKYQHLFSFGRFFFTRYYEDDCDVLGFVLFDREKVHHLYQKHTDLLSSVFGSEDNMVTYLQLPSWENQKKCKNLHAYDAALGVLLGYGIRNSLTYGEGLAIANLLDMAPFHLQGLNSKDTKMVLLRDGKLLEFNEEVPSFDLSHNFLKHSIERLNFLRLHHQRIAASQRETALSPITIPGFGAFRNETETLQVQEACDRIREWLVKIYYSENFLETILTQLTS